MPKCYKQVRKTFLFTELASVVDTSGRMCRPLQRSKLSFAFSGCGWLTSYHLGVIKKLKESRLLTSESVVSGSSGGAIAATLSCLDVDLNDSMNQSLQAFGDPLFHKNIDVGLRKLIRSSLPPDSYLKCNDRLYITVTQVAPKFHKRATLISNFESDDDLVDAIAASCFIPFWSSKKTSTVFQSAGRKGEKYIDGGVFEFMPRIGNVTVTPLPHLYRIIHPRRGPPSISPSNIPNFPYSTPTLVRWSLFPPTDKPELLWELFRYGEQSAEAWIRDYEKSELDGNLNKPL
jgi:hypothetical protein